MIKKVNKLPQSYIHDKDILNLKEKLNQLAKDGHVNKVTAAKFMERSAWWDQHLSGWIRCKGDSNRIIGGDPEWYVIYGNNHFVVGHALLECKKEIERFLDSLEPDSNYEKRDYIKLRERLIKLVTWSVRSSSEWEYYPGYPLDNNKMRLGTHAIDVNDFVNEIFRIVPIDIFITDKIKEKKLEEYSKRAISLLHSVINKLNNNDLPKEATFFLEEMVEIDPAFEIEKTKFQNIDKLIEHFEKAGMIKAENGSGSKNIVGVYNKRKLSKQGKQYYKRLLNTQRPNDAAEYSINILTSADQSLNTTQKSIPSNPSIFSSLSRAILFNGHSLELLRQNILFLFYVRDYRFENDGAEIHNVTSVEVQEITREILEAAGFVLPNSQ